MNLSETRRGNLYQRINNNWNKDEFIIKTPEISYIVDNKKGTDCPLLNGIANQLLINNNINTVNVKSRFVKLNIKTGDINIYIPTVEDAEANDWEIYITDVNFFK